MTPPRFLAIGECMIEIAPATGGLYSMLYAGDTFNTAWYIQRQLASGTVGYCTATGDDSASTGMVDFMTGAGITTHIRQVADRTVGLYAIHIDNGERSFSYWRSNSAAKQLAADPAWLTQQLAGHSHIYFSGITLAILDAQDRPAFLDAIRNARENGASIIFDTNLRPKLWPNVDAMRTEISAAAKLADVVLPSFDDEAACFGDATPADTIARYDAPLTVVKNAGDPVTVQYKGKAATTHPVMTVTDVVDSTAAGDSFNAGFLAAWMQGKSADESVAAGSKLAAYVVTGKGALVD